MVNLEEAVSFSYSKERSRLNQDSILPPMSIGGGYVFAIADGVGSYDGGEVASSLAIDQVKSFDGKHSSAAVDKLFLAARDRVVSFSESEERYSRAATTLTFCFVNEEGLTIGHIGDCRLYVKVGSKLKLCTKDHTQYQQLIDDKVFSKKFLSDKKARNILTSAIAKDVNFNFEHYFFPIEDLETEGDVFDVYIMSDGAHFFWDKRPRFSQNTMSSTVKFARSLKERIEKSGPIDDFSVVGASIRLL